MPVKQGTETELLYWQGYLTTFIMRQWGGCCVMGQGKLCLELRRFLRVPLSALIESKPYMAIAGNTIWQRYGNQSIRILRHESMIYHPGQALLAS